MILIYSSYFSECASFCSINFVLLSETKKKKQWKRINRVWFAEDTASRARTSYTHTRADSRNGGRKATKNDFTVIARVARYRKGTF